MVDKSKKEKTAALTTTEPVQVVHSEKEIQTVVEFKVTKSDVVDMIMIDEEMRLDELIDSLAEESKTLDKEMKEATKKYDSELLAKAKKEINLLSPMAKETMGADPVIRTGSSVEYFIDGPGEHRRHKLNGVVVLEATMTKKKRIEAAGYTEEEYKEFEEDRCYYGNREDKDFYVLIPVKRKLIDAMPEVKAIKAIYHRKCKNTDAKRQAQKDLDLLVNKSRKAKARITKTLLEQNSEGSRLLSNIRSASKGLIKGSKK